MTADPEFRPVYLVTNGATIDYYGGHHPGDNLFSTSVIAPRRRHRRAALALPVRVPSEPRQRREPLILLAILELPAILPNSVIQLRNRPHERRTRRQKVSSQSATGRRREATS